MCFWISSFIKTTMEKTIIFLASFLFVNNVVSQRLRNSFLFLSHQNFEYFFVLRTLQCGPLVDNCFGNIFWCSNGDSVSFFAFNSNCWRGNCSWRFFLYFNLSVNQVLTFLNVQYPTIAVLEVLLQRIYVCRIPVQLM